MMNKLKDRAARNFKPLIAAHRGTYSGNFVQNTIAAYENSLVHKADIIEMDIERSKDGVLYLMHTDMESMLLGCNKSIRDMMSEEIDSLKYLNIANTEVNQRVNRLEEALVALNGRCLINIDRGWDFFPQLFDTVKKHKMLNQIIFKSPIYKEVFEQIKEFGHTIHYMPIVSDIDEIEKAISFDISLIGFELLFKSNDSEFAQDRFIKKMHEAGYILWVNALSICDECNMSAMHSDEIAILQNMDLGWGWLINKGYDVIQTDWPLLLYNYMKGYK